MTLPSVCNTHISVHRSQTGLGSSDNIFSSYDPHTDPNIHHTQSLGDGDTLHASTCLQILFKSKSWEAVTGFIQFKHNIWQLQDEHTLSVSHETITESTTATVLLATIKIGGK